MDELLQEEIESSLEYSQKKGELNLEEILIMAQVIEKLRRLKWKIFPPGVRPANGE